ncbi:MAG: AAA family ATPase [Candidatus Limivivens sp.]|nr:AAA family ATPase [Candidatus Limivivens sp.]
MSRVKLPIGVENFEKIRHDGYYYVDKTKLIEQVLNKGNEVVLFTRPRRFGKSLNMSMLRYFFEAGTDKTLFDGLFVAKNKELCDKYMGKFPVVSISLKGVNARNYQEAFHLLAEIINEEAERLQFLTESEKLSQIDKTRFERLLSENMSHRTLVSSLRRLTNLLAKHYGEKVIVLIDEYDVPLAKANENGYYDEMVLLVRNLFENALKTNDSLKFAVLTGCLRVAKESIFTGLNNLKVYSITDVEFDESFGFTDDEVKALLHYYGLEDHYEQVKEWYNGYRFGKADVYCPWDVINYCSDHLSDPYVEPKNYWLNTSGNDVINHFIDSVNEKRQLTKTELERLVSGETVQKEINQELTYKEIYSTIENLWSTLFITGYLTQRGDSNGNRYNLAVPNREIRNIMTEHILAMFKKCIAQDGKMVNDFCNALLNGDPDKVERLFTAYMETTISVRDTFVRKPIREKFYHSLLLGILSFKDGWCTASNKESGDGFSDILIQIDNADMGIVIEIKYSETEKKMERDCKEALKQIVNKNYTEALHPFGIHKILKYGISCNIKKCRVMLEIEDVHAEPD